MNKEIIEALAANYCPLSILLIAVGMAISMIVSAGRGRPWVEFTTKGKDE